MSRDAEEVELELLIKAETPAAYLVAEAEDEEGVWLPKSQIDVEGNPQKGKVSTFLIPEWLAIEKGLV